MWSEGENGTLFCSRNLFLLIKQDWTFWKTIILRQEIFDKATNCIDSTILFVVWSNTLLYGLWLIGTLCGSGICIVFPAGTPCSLMVRFRIKWKWRFIVFPLNLCIICICPSSCTVQIREHTVNTDTGWRWGQVYEVSEGREMRLGWGGCQFARGMRGLNFPWVCWKRGKDHVVKLLGCPTPSKYA